MKQKIARTVCLPQTAWDAIHARAESLGLSRSSYVSLLVLSQLEQQKEDASQ